MFYTVCYGNEITAVRLAIVKSDNNCGTRSRINFCLLYVEKFAYDITNYGMVVLTSRTSGNKIYTRYYKAESGVTILELVKCAYVIYRTIACSTTLAVKIHTRVPV